MTKTVNLLQAKNMKTKPEINPFIEKLIDEQPKVFDEVNKGKPFYIGNRKYRIVNKYLL